VPHGDLLDKLRGGIKLEDGITAPAEVEYVDINPDKNETIVSITIHEGRNRQVRRMFEAISYPVIKLKRIQFGTLLLAGLQRGKHRALGKAEIEELRESALQSHNVQKSPE
jgi:23S rRNA pseudouridine2605 synthase